ncbi:MAG: hypothetical protein V3U87_17845 [Methylococcaceae bacterium]
MNEKQLLSIEDMFKKLNMSRTSFYRLRTDKENPFIEPVIKNPMRWSAKAVDAFLNLGEQNDK